MKGSVYKVKNRFIVRFGRDITKAFSSQQEAERFLTGLRYETDEKKFDKRDYAAGNPLAFNGMAEKWLILKRQSVRDATYANIKKYIDFAIEEWGNTNVKTIGYPELEDLIASYPAGQKTKANIKSVLHDLFAWMFRRRVIREMPEFPEVKFELAWRTIISPETQSSVLDEVYRLTWDMNRKMCVDFPMILGCYHS